MKIKTYNGFEVFLTSDLHFYHWNIVKYCDRDFSSIEEMNETLINNWNSVVKPSDTVFELGDMFPFCSIDNALTILTQLNGKIISLKGNHWNPKIQEKTPWIEYYDYLEIYVKDDEIPKQHICLFHYPIESWNGQFKGSWHLFGHSHNLSNDWKEAKMDVGVDSGNNYTPYSYQQVKEQITKQLLYGTLQNNI